MGWRSAAWMAAWALAAPACSKDNSGDPGADDGAADGLATLSGEPTTQGDGGPSSATDEGGADSETGAGNGGVSCDGQIYACADGTDNDGDGLIDAEDPECTRPCDDDEASFQTGLPGDNVDCKQDCFFDGNSGQGDDGCIWDLRCDPENPGADIGCEYSEGQNCNNSPPNQSTECIEFCSGFVPNGCDCFGCCTIETSDGPVSVFLNSGPDCSLANLDACASCTPNESCSNPCVPEDCEVCFGETEPDPTCGQPECPEGLEPCVEVGEGHECPAGFYCVTGCCVEFTPPP